MNAAGVDIVRPVVRLGGGSTVLTRIMPERRETSMIFKMRQGWASIYKYLVGAEADPSNPDRLV